jgi:hypothetical protein
MSVRSLGLIAAMLVAAPAAAAVRDKGLPGQVEFLSGERAYLDRGRSHGLVVGQTVTLTRGKQKLTCVVERVNSRAATCLGRGLSVGDRFELGAFVPSPLSGPPPKRLPALATPQQLERQRQLLEHAPLEQVSFSSTGATRVLRLRGGQVRASHRAWVGEGGGFHREELHLSVPAAEVAQRVRVSLDLTAFYWSQRPATFRMVQPSATVLLRRAEVSLTNDASALVLSGGRTWPRFTPGLTMLDGAQAGWRSASGERELGLYAGALPEPSTLAPRFETWTVGGYLMETFPGSLEEWRATRLEARLAFTRWPGLSDRGEAELAGHTWLSRLSSAHAQVLATTDQPLEFVRADVDARPLAPLPVRLGFRYMNEAAREVLLVGSSFRGRRSAYADASVGWEGVGWLQVEAHGGYAHDLRTSLRLMRAGGEVAFPMLFVGRGGLAIGHDEEFGWLRGRTTYAQANVRPVDWARLWLRASLFQQLAGGSAGGLAGSELGESAAVDVRIGSVFWLRAHLLLRQDLRAPVEGEPPRVGGMIGSLSLGGDF